MQLTIAAIGHKMPAWIDAGFAEYAKRMPNECRLYLKEIKPVERSSNKNAETVMVLERKRLEAAIPKGSRVIALDEHGKDITSQQLAHYLRDWLQSGTDVTFV